MVPCWAKAEAQRRVSEAIRAFKQVLRVVGAEGGRIAEGRHRKAKGPLSSGPALEATSGVSNLPGCYAAGRYRKRLLQPGRLETPEVASGVVCIDARKARKLAAEMEKISQGDMSSRFRGIGEWAEWDFTTEDAESTGILGRSRVPARFS